MHNRVIFETDCPACETLIKHFETNDGEGDYVFVSLEDVNNVFATCPNCGVDVEFDRINQEKNWYIDRHEFAMINPRLNDIEHIVTEGDALMNIRSKNKFVREYCIFRLKKSKKKKKS